MEKTLHEAIENRRSIYAISADTAVSDERIKALIAHALRHAPSPYNSQSPRAVLLLGKANEKLWNIVLETLRKIVPEKDFGATQEKIGGFAAGHGTVLFFEDADVTAALCDQFPIFRENFIKWAQHANSMAQYAVWLSLEAEGLGASLQHYNPLIDEAVKQAWNLPESYQLIAQMPFGRVTEKPEEKEFMPIEERLFIFNT